MKPTETKEIVFRASVLASVDRDNKIFQGDNNQILRIIREMAIETAKQPESIPEKQLLQFACGLRDEFKQTLIRNNRRVSAFKLKQSNLLKLDPAAYANDLAKNAETMTEIDNFSKNVRSQLEDMDKLVTQIQNKQFDTRRSNLLTKITNSFRLRSAIRNIVKDKELFNWIITKPIVTLEEFQEFLKTGNINEQENMMKDFAKSVRTDMERFRKQVVMLKPYIQLRNLPLYVKVLEFEQDDLTDLSRGVEFINEFKKYYLTVNTLEEFLKIDGITDELTDSMDMVLGIHNIIGKLIPGANYSEESVNGIQEMLNASISQNKILVDTAYALARSFSYKIAGIDLDNTTDEELYKVNTLLLCSTFNLLDIRSASSTLTLLAKMD